MPVGTIRTWEGRKYLKTSQGWITHSDEDKQFKKKAKIFHKEMREEHGGSWVGEGAVKHKIRLVSLLIDQGKAEAVKANGHIKVRFIKSFILNKAKYTKRWKGKDGKWHYEYGEPKGSSSKAGIINSLKSAGKVSGVNLSNEELSDLYYRGVEPIDVKAGIKHTEKLSKKKASDIDTTTLMKYIKIKSRIRISGEIYKSTNPVIQLRKAKYTNVGRAKMANGIMSMQNLLKQ